MADKVRERETSSHSLNSESINKQDIRTDQHIKKKKEKENVIQKNNQAIKQVNRQTDGKENEVNAIHL